MAGSESGLGRCGVDCGEEVSEDVFSDTSARPDGQLDADIFKKLFSGGGGGNLAGGGGRYEFRSGTSLF